MGPCGLGRTLLTFYSELKRSAEDRNCWKDLARLPSTQDTRRRRRIGRQQQDDTTNLQCVSCRWRQRTSAVVCQCNMSDRSSVWHCPLEQRSAAVDTGCWDRCRRRGASCASVPRWWRPAPAWTVPEGSPGMLHIQYSYRYLLVIYLTTAFNATSLSKTTVFSSTECSRRRPLSASLVSGQDSAMVSNEQTFIRLWQPLIKAGLHRHTKLHNAYIMQWRYWNYCQWFSPYIMREFL